ncbi:MAG: hypothetical protein K0R14_1845 [Burkholderiales bacterium]|jgi:hypothetical protein|nr:hypothetical protein [Burkholderiales bacterium]
MKLQDFWQSKIFFLILIVNNLYADDRAKWLIESSIKASGGKDALMQMKSISRYGKITFYSPDNTSKTYCYKTNIIYPTKLREQIKSDQILIDRGTDGVSYWSWANDHYQFINDKDTEARDYLQKTAERANRDMLWVLKEADAYNIMPLPPAWAPANTQCISQINSGKQRIYCFHNYSGLLLALGNNDEYRIESDWKTVGAIKLPFRLTQYQKGKIAYEVILNHAHFNDVIAASQFTKPKIPQYSCE